MTRVIPSFRQAGVCACGAHGFVALTKGYVALISPDRVPDVGRHRWRASTKITKRRRYVYGSAWINGRDAALHRYLTGAPSGMDVDHRDADTLNNCDSNLRVCTHLENMQSQRGLSGPGRFKGVYAVGCGWRSIIRVAENRMNLGLFSCPIEAARAYDSAAVEHFKDFALTNAQLGLLP